MNKLTNEVESRDREERFFVTWSEKISRKGFVVSLGGFILRLAGISFLSILPVDKIAEADPSSCDDWTLCGICGTLCCAGCTGGVGGSGTCPSCASRGTGFWSACCVGGGGLPPYNCHTVKYYDCCSTVTCSCPIPPCLSCCIKKQNAWCSTGNYVCTVAITGGSCACL